MLSEAHLILTSYNCKLHCLLQRYKEQMSDVTEIYLYKSRQNKTETETKYCTIKYKLTFALDL